MFISFYETPSTALAPELTDDYDERSALLSYRSYFGWTGGNAMSVFMFIGAVSGVRDRGDHRTASSTATPTRPTASSPPG